LLAITFASLAELQYGKLKCCFSVLVLYWFSLKWKIARFELAGKDDNP